jgi:hypothetical protein
MIAADRATGLFPELERALSKSRLHSYKTDRDTNDEALCKYIWNTLLCESLYPGFQILEVAFRNSLHAELSKHTKDSQWLTNEIGFLFPDELQAIRESKRSIQQRNLTLTEDFLVAEMSFGFWTSLLDSRYETMWHKIITGVFPNMPRTMRTRKDASKLMNAVRKLRNAALHHHSIWHWKDLKDQHDQMQLLIGYICNINASIAAQVDRFSTVYSDGHKQCEKVVLAISKKA